MALTAVSVAHWLLLRLRLLLPEVVVAVVEVLPAAVAAAVVEGGGNKDSVKCLDKPFILLIFLLA
jgi:zinc transporter ZupT